MRSYIRDAFWPERSTGAGYFTLKRPATDDAQDVEPLGILFFLRQTVRQELGRTSEEQLSLRAFTISKGEGPVALSSQDTAKIIRNLADATRTRAPVNCGLEPTLVSLETELVDQLRRPTDEEIQAQIRHVVWPIAAIITI